MFEHHLDHAALLFLILVDDVDRRVVGRHGIVLVSGSVLRHLDRREEFLNFGFNLVNVDVAHHDDTLKVGTIPLLVVCAEFSRLEVVDHAHQTDGVAMAVA